MIFFLLAHGWSVLLDLMWLGHRTQYDNDIEILLLRQQLLILQPKQLQPSRISRWEKLTLLVLAGKLTTMTTSARARLGQSVLLFKPETLLTWHRELVRRKWAFRVHAARGRPPISPELEALLLRLANENRRWGYGKLQGKVRKLGYAIGLSTVRDASNETWFHQHRTDRKAAAVGVRSPGGHPAITKTKSWPVTSSRSKRRG